MKRVAGVAFRGEHFGILSTQIPHVWNSFSLLVESRRSHRALPRAIFRARPAALRSCGATGASAPLHAHPPAAPVRWDRRVRASRWKVAAREELRRGPGVKAAAQADQRRRATGRRRARCSAVRRLLGGGI